MRVLERRGERGSRGRENKYNSRFNRNARVKKDWVRLWYTLGQVATKEKKV